MKIKLIFFLYTLIYNSSSYAVSDAAVSALFGGLLYAVIFGVGFGICYYIFTNIFGFFKKAADDKSINNLNQQRSNNINTQTQNNTQVNTISNKKDKTAIKTDDSLNITATEEEEIYTKVFREFSDNRKEGMWTKALIQSDGDENKAKINYMRLRVEQLKEELKEFKIDSEKESMLKIENEHENINKFFSKNLNHLKVIKQLEFLVSYAHENKIKGDALILTDYISKIYGDRTSITSKNLKNVFYKLHKLISASYSDKKNDIKTIKAEEIEKIITDHRSGR